MSQPFNFDKLSAALDEAEATLAALGPGLDPAMVEDLAERIERARRNLDSLALLKGAREHADNGPFWRHLSGFDRRAPDSPGELPD